VPEPLCIICGAPIRSGDLTVFLHGDLAHQTCYSGPSDDTERVARFLRQAPSRRFCNVCIATGCDLGHAEAVKATTQLRLRPEFRVVVGARCSGCDQVRITFGVRNQSAAGEHQASG
jgi:hypothetical protein